ncbi:MAG: potassium/hydrogen antiporter [Pseudonocardiales bacterium]|nr:potassium/hydrogen antiporter [Pseudonocardiales bacterium]
MKDVEPFAVIVGLIAAALLLAVLSNRITDKIRVPAPALFLVIAAVASDLIPQLGSLPIQTVERIVTLALIFILFDGGMHIGWRRFRTAAGAVLWIGVAGTVVTAGALALAAHLFFGFDWRVALLIGTALAPTDPAVVFSVLGRREISGRSGTILEGESGANDPVGIALMVALLGASGGGLHEVLGGIGEFGLQMAVGGVVGILGASGLIVLMRQLPLPNEALYPIRTLAGAAIIYGLATVAHGSGFLAVFLAGILIGDARAPYKREIERFAGGISTLGEIVAFTVLGLTVSVHDVLRADTSWVGLALAALLILIIRPLFVGALIARIDLARGERLFVLWSGLKGAVPILLGTFILTGDIADSHRIYEIIFVVVLVSVVVQGGLVPTFAQVLRVPMQTTPLEPWTAGLRFQDEPDGLHRHLVGAGSEADGCAIADLPMVDAWISMVNRDGQLLQVRADTVLRAGDEVLILGDPGTQVVEAFTGRPGDNGQRSPG